MTPFEKWYKRADTYIQDLSYWQYDRLKTKIKKAYEAGRKQGREEATVLAEKAIVLRGLLNKPSKGK